MGHGEHDGPYNIKKSYKGEWPIIQRFLPSVFTKFRTIGVRTVQFFKFSVFILFGGPRQMMISILRSDEVGNNRFHRCWWWMFETECVGDNYKMLVTVLAILVTKIHYLHGLPSLNSIALGATSSGQRTINITWPDGLAAIHITFDLL